MFPSAKFPVGGAGEKNSSGGKKCGMSGGCLMAGQPFNDVNKDGIIVRLPLSHFSSRYLLKMVIKPHLDKENVKKKFYGKSSGCR